MQAKSAEVATAQSPTPSQLVQQGIEQYRAGDVLSAIASWQTALTAYQNTNNLADAAIVREKLALAYQQIGQFENAIDSWQPAIANYRSVGDMVKVERLLVEQAQTYSRWGQNKEAIALLIYSLTFASFQPKVWTGSRTTFFCCPTHNSTDNA